MIRCTLLSFESTFPVIDGYPFGGAGPHLVPEICLFRPEHTKYLVDAKRGYPSSTKGIDGYT